MFGEILIYLVYCAVIFFVCYFGFLRKENKELKRRIEQYEGIIKELQVELKAVNKKNEALMWACGNKVAREQVIQKQKQMQRQAQEPAFLHADDPLDALLKEVGKVKR